MLLVGYGEEAILILVGLALIIFQVEEVLIMDSMFLMEMAMLRVMPGVVILVGLILIQADLIRIILITVFKEVAIIWLVGQELWG